MGTWICLFISLENGILLSSDSILLHNTLIHAQLMISYEENIDQQSKPSCSSFQTPPPPPLFQLGLGGGGGGGITRPTPIEWAGGWAAPFPTARLKNLSKKEWSAPIRYLSACYVISHTPLHAQLPMGC